MKKLIALSLVLMLLMSGFALADQESEAALTEAVEGLESDGAEEDIDEGLSEGIDEEGMEENDDEALSEGTDEEGIEEDDDEALSEETDDEGEDEEADSVEQDGEDVSGKNVAVDALDEEDIENELLEEELEGELSTEFTFRNGLHWGSSSRYVLYKEGNPQKYNEEVVTQALTFLEIDNVRAAGLPANLNFGFLEGSMVLAGYEFSRDVASIIPLYNSMVEKYGEPLEDDGGARFSEIMSKLHNKTYKWKRTVGSALYAWEFNDDTYIVLTNYYNGIQIAYFGEKLIMEYGAKQSMATNTSGL